MHLEPEGPEEVPSPRTEPLEENPQGPEEPEADPLSSSVVIGSFYPFERTVEPFESTPIQSLFTQILDFNRPRTNRMATPPATETKEIKLNPPKAFDINRDKFRKFLQDAELYLAINHKTYDDDLKKIGFILSFMTEGQAAAWGDQFMEEA